jgi:hypothetical protein
MTDVPAAKFDLDSAMKPILEASRYFKFLVYGDPKVGKTTFAATAPNPLILAVEPGTAVLTKNEENRKRFAHVKEYPCESLKVLEEVIAATRAGQGADRETYVFDTLTEFEDRTLAAYMKYIVKANPDKDKNEYNPEWPEYKAVTAILRKAMLELRDLEKHIIVICHCRDDADKTRGGMSVDRPALMPKLSSTLLGMFNLIGYMYVDYDGTYRMRVVPTPNIVAGNHIWSGEAVIDNPTFDMFLKGQ